MNEEFLERKRRFMESEPFKRMVGNFEIFQKLLAEVQNEDEKKVLNLRMREVFSPSKETVEDEQINRLRQDLFKIFEQIFKLCENGQFSLEKAADLMAGSLAAEKILEEWNQKPGVERETEKIVIKNVNEVIKFDYGKDNNELIINIPPTSVSGSELFAKAVEGLKLIAGMIENGELSEVKKIKMMSWLLGKAFEEKIRMIFGDGIELSSVSEEDAVDVQKLALTYNRRSLETFLKTGQRPEVRLLEMDKEQFLERFGE